MTASKIITSTHGACCEGLTPRRKIRSSTISSSTTISVITGGPSSHSRRDRDVRRDGRRLRGDESLVMPEPIGQADRAPREVAGLEAGQDGGASPAEGDELDRTTGERGS